MTWKTWEEEVRWATWCVPATESKCSFDPPLRRNAKAILAADRELTRRGERIERLEKVAEIAAQRPNEFGPHFMMWIYKMDAALDALKEGK